MTSPRCSPAFLQLVPSSLVGGGKLENPSSKKRVSPGARFPVTARHLAIAITAKIYFAVSKHRSRLISLASAGNSAVDGVTSNSSTTFRVETYRYVDSQSFSHETPAKRHRPEVLEFGRTSQISSTAMAVSERHILHDAAHATRRETVTDLRIHRRRQSRAPLSKTTSSSPPPS